MTKEEIQALINAKIAGQGSAVDVGGALPAILSEILNLATAPKKPVILTVVSFVEDGTAQDALNALQINGQNPTFDELAALDYSNVVILNSGQYYIPTFYIISDTSLGISAGFASTNFEESIDIDINVDANTGNVKSHSM